jgi:photosystem II stability/assembly factor-like uncharacterized protein
MTNSSDSWKSYLVQTTKDYARLSLDICFYNHLNGWMVENNGSEGKLLKTNDGGRKWSVVIIH